MQNVLVIKTTANELIPYKYPGVRKPYTRWFPYSLTDEKKTGKNQRAISFYRNLMAECLRYIIITLYEIWQYQFDPAIKQQSTVRMLLETFLLGK